MQIHPSVYYAGQIFVLLCGAIVVAIISYYIFASNIDRSVSDSARKADIVRMQANAKTYYARMQFYDDVCEVIGAGGKTRCHGDEGSFAIETRLSDGTFYCADSTRAAPVVLSESKGRKTSCR